MNSNSHEHRLSYLQHRSNLPNFPLYHHQHTLSEYLLGRRLGVRWFEGNTRYLEPEPQL